MGARRLNLALIRYLSPANRLALRTFFFSSDWTKFLWKATRACGWHKVISHFTVTLKWYATCRTVNSPLPVTDRNWPGWGPAKWVFQLMWARAPKQTLEGNQNQQELGLLRVVMAAKWLAGYLRLYCGNTTNGSIQCYRLLKVWFIIYFPLSMSTF